MTKAEAQATDNYRAMCECGHSYRQYHSRLGTWCSICCTDCVDPEVEDLYTQSDKLFSQIAKLEDKYKANLSIQKTQVRDVKAAVRRATAIPAKIPAKIPARSKQ